MTEARLTELPKKIMAAAAIIRDTSGRLLMVKPTYRDHWQLPGGIVERAEPPRAACAREVLEETGLDITPGPMLVIDYTDEWEGLVIDHLELIFDGGLLPKNSCRYIRLPKQEIAEARCIAPE